MTRTAYHRPPDHPTPLDLERVVETRAADLHIGDVIAAKGFVPLVVIGVHNVVCGMTSVAYECAAGCGTRVYPSEQVIQIRRRVVEAGH